jgi:hypothetical protein
MSNQPLSPVSKKMAIIAKSYELLTTQTYPLKLFLMNRKVKYLCQSCVFKAVFTKVESVLALALWAA